VKVMRLFLENINDKSKPNANSKYKTFKLTN